MLLGHLRSNIRATLLLLVVGLCCHFRAEAEVLNCSPSKTTIVFVNGVWNTDVEAQANRDYLEKIIRANLPADQVSRLSFDYLYNGTNGKAADLRQTLVQAFNSNYMQVNNWLAGIDVVPTTLRTRFMAEANKAQLYDVDAPTTAVHLNAYAACLNLADGKVIVVPHSQGNFYANRAFSQLYAGFQPRFSIVSVANPDNCLRDKCDAAVQLADSYATSTTDLIVDAARLIPGLAPLQANVSNSPILGDPFGHQFVKAYLRDGSESKLKILNDIASAELALFNPPPTSATSFSDSFELYTSGTFPSSGGWFIRSGAEGIGASAQLVTTARANAGARSLQLSSAQGLGVNVQKFFTPPTHPYALEAYINTTRTDSKNAFIGFGNANNVNAGVRFVSGRGIAVLNSETVPSTVIAFGGGYDADIWIKLRIVVDPATSTYVVYKNNVLATQGLSAAAPTGLTDRIWVGVDNSGVDVVGGTTAYFDDVSVVDCPTGSTASACGSGTPPSNLITFVATGTVTQRDYSAGVMSTFFTTPPEVGDTFTLKYTFDQSTVDTDARSNIGIFGGAVRSAVLTVGSNASVSLAQTNFVPLDQISTEFSLTDPFNNYSVATGGTYNAQAFSVGFTLGGAPAGYFTSDALPAIAPAPAVFLSKTLSFSGGGTFTGTLSSLTRQ